MSDFRVSKQRLGGGAVEIGIRNATNDLVAVITHPCKGAKWFLHGVGFAPKRKFPTEKAAMDAVISENRC